MRPSSRGENHIALSFRRDRNPIARYQGLETDHNSLHKNLKMMNDRLKAYDYILSKQKYLAGHVGFFCCFLIHPSPIVNSGNHAR
jgi:hypothetical protein